MSPLIIVGLIGCLTILSIAQESDSTKEKSAGDGVAKFEKKLDEWREAIIELQLIRQEYYLAKTLDESIELQEKYDATKKAGNQVVKDLKLAAAQAYMEAPREGSQYHNFLINTIGFELEQTENQELAYKIAKALNSRPISRPEIARRVGMSLFLNAEFDAAEKLLKFALEGNDEGLSSLRQSLFLIPQLKEAWAKELQRRERDKQSKLPRAVFETTKGKFVVELFEDDAPNTVKNFVKLAKQGFYDDLFFFQVLPLSYAVSGSPNSNASGSPGYILKNEGLDREKRRANFRGTLCVPARDENANVAGSLFMITFGPYPPANGDSYCNFGRVIQGMEVVDSMERSHDKNNQPIQTFQPDKIIKVTVENLREGTKYEPEIIPLSQ